MTKELQKKAEDFIIDRYKLNECYREDNAETREYMRIDVHSQHEEEYQLYLDATKELQKENTELENDYKLIDKSREHLVQEKYNLEYKIENLENKIEHHQEVINTLQKENAELKKQLEMSNKVYNDNLDYTHHIEGQLTTAKEIIREFVEWANWQGNSKCPSFKSIQDKAEQFIKYSEVENDSNS